MTQSLFQLTGWLSAGRGRGRRVVVGRPLLYGRAAEGRPAAYSPLTDRGGEALYQPMPACRHLSGPSRRSPMRPVGPRVAPVGVQASYRQAGRVLKLGWDSRTVSELTGGQLFSRRRVRQPVKKIIGAFVCLVTASAPGEIAHLHQSFVQAGHQLPRGPIWRRLMHVPGPIDLSSADTLLFLYLFLYS